MESRASRVKHGLAWLAGASALRSSNPLSVLISIELLRLFCTKCQVRQNNDDEDDDADDDDDGGNDDDKNYRHPAEQQNVDMRKDNLHI